MPPGVEPRYIVAPPAPQRFVVQQVAVMVHNRGSAFEEALKARVTAHLAAQVTPASQPSQPSPSSQPPQATQPSASSQTTHSSQPPQATHTTTTSKWSFLLEEGSTANLFYRWCVLVLGSGEDFAAYSLLPFQFVQGGDWFVPPPVQDERTVHDRLEAMASELKTKAIKREHAGDVEDAREKRRREELGWALCGGLTRRSNLLLDTVAVATDLAADA